MGQCRRKRKAVPFGGRTGDLRQELLFFFVCAGPSDVVLLAELEENFIEPFFLWVMATIPGGIGKNIAVRCLTHDIHLVSLK